MRIAMIGQKGIPAVYGGIERHVEELSVRLVKHNQCVTVYNRPWYAAKKTLYKGVRVVTLKSIRTKHLDAISHTLVSTLHALATGHDIIHFHGVGPALLAWIPRLLRPSARVVVTFHSIDRKHKKWGGFARAMLRMGEWAACRFAHRTIAVSHAIQRYTQTVYDTSSVYIPNGVEEIAVARTNALIKTRFGLKKDGYIMVVTRLIPHKGVHFLISAFRALPTEKKLVIVGEGTFTKDYEEYLKELASKDDRIIFTGFQSGKALHELYSNALLIVQPTEAEGLSLALLEALNYAKPVLASDIEENKEVMADYGWYFKSGNTSDLKRQLAQMLSQNTATLKKTGKRGQLYVRNEFNWEAIARQTLTLYKTIYEHTRRGSLALKHHQL